jgi:hypothetical protein
MSGNEGTCGHFIMILKRCSVYPHEGECREYAF